MGKDRGGNKRDTETETEIERDRHKGVSGSSYCFINVISFGDFYRECKKYLIAFQLHLNTRPIFSECNS